MAVSGSVQSDSSSSSESLQEELSLTLPLLRPLIFVSWRSLGEQLLAGVLGSAFTNEELLKTSLSDTEVGDEA